MVLCADSQTSFPFAPGHVGGKVYGIGFANLAVRPEKGVCALAFGTASTDASGLRSRPQITGGPFKMTTVFQKSVERGFVALVSFASTKGCDLSRPRCPGHDGSRCALFLPRWTDRY